MYRIAIFFILIGIAVKYAKMHFLIAGYNTMSAKGKQKIDVEGIATLLRNVMFSMAGLIIIGSIISYYFNWPEIESYIFFPTLAVCVVWLIIQSNSKKYRIDR